MISAPILTLWAATTGRNCPITGGAVSLNNQPIRAGAVIGTHNGTIINADRLFKRYRLRRAAETDSEFIFRLADKKKSIEDFTACARNVRGGMSAVFTRTSAPDTVLVVKGNKPLTLWYHKEFRAVFYSSEEWPLERVIGGSRDVVPLESKLTPKQQTVYCS